MPDLAGPFDASTFAQAQFYRDRGYLEPSGVQGLPAATPAAGDLGLTAAGFALTLGLGRARVRGAAYERTGSAWTLTVPANTSSAGPRNDLLVLRRDLTAKTVVPTYLQGVAAASPADPAVTQVEDGVWDERLFRVQAPASSGTPLVITDLRRFLGSGDVGPVVIPLAAPLAQGANGGCMYWVRNRVCYVTLEANSTTVYPSGYVINSAALPLPAGAYSSVAAGGRSATFFTGQWQDTNNSAVLLYISPTGFLTLGFPGSNGATKNGITASFCYPIAA
jgi:hypothetical protein